MRPWGAGGGFLPSSGSHSDSWGCALMGWAGLLQFLLMGRGSALGGVGPGLSPLSCLSLLQMRVASLLSSSRLWAGGARPSPWGTGPLASPESGLLNPDLLMSPPPGSSGQSAHLRPPHPSRFPRTEPKSTRTWQGKLRPPLCWSEREGCTVTSSAEGGEDGNFPNPKLGGPCFIPGLRWGLGGSPGVFLTTAHLQPST